MIKGYNINVDRSQYKLSSYDTMPLRGPGRVHRVATPIPSEDLSYISRSHGRSALSGNSSGPFKSVNGVRLTDGVLELLLRYTRYPFISFFRYDI